MLAYKVLYCKAFKAFNKKIYKIANLKHKVNYLKLKVV